jgi:general secretion pathway protein L
MDAIAAPIIPQGRLRRRQLGTTMRIGAGLISWFKTLAAIVDDLRQWRRDRRSAVVRREGERFIVRRALEANAAVVAAVAVGTPLPSDVARSLRNHSVNFELGAADVVTRFLTVPVQAKDVLPGIVRNQIERLSPWPIAKAAYGFDAVKSKQDSGSLDVRISILPRKTIDAICDQLAISALTPHRIVARAGGDDAGPFLTLWTRPSAVRRSTAIEAWQGIAAALGALLAISTAATLWAFVSANELGAERDDVAARAQAFRQPGSSSAAKALLASQSPGQRAWTMKESAPAAVMIIEALTKALPDDAYLTELSLERANLRVSGFAADAPPLIAALEQSGRFSGAHFFAATTKDAESGRYKFNVEARVAPIGD